ncbi:MAG: hypothetical protein ACE145_09870 [Terriglobia bacterium]
MTTQKLVDELLLLADRTEVLSGHVVELRDSPLAMRVGITDRLIQLTCLLRLAAKEIERPLGTEKSFNVPIDA